ncbi:MAG: transposase [cyanobacterium endosymbiont of Rhopalodia sterrenbergii]
MTNLEKVSMDVGNIYMKILSELIPQTKIVVDRFNYITEKIF